MGKNEIHPKRLDYLDVNDDACQFGNNVDVLNEAFGFGESMLMKAGYPRNPQKSIPGTKPGDKFRIWLPKLYGNKSGWHNILSDDGKHFYEKSEDSKAVDWMDIDDSGSKALSLIFVKEKRNTPYRFVGVFKAGKMERLNHTYDRIATGVKLIGNPVNRIELLDDIR